MPKTVWINGFHVEVGSPAYTRLIAEGNEPEDPPKGADLSGSDGPADETEPAEAPAAPEYGKRTNPDLEDELRSRGIDPESIEGSGRDGQVVKKDLVAALEANDETSAETLGEGGA